MKSGSYNKLGKFKYDVLRGLQTLALTATAPPFVREQIKGRLDLSKPLREVIMPMYVT